MEHTDIVRNTSSRTFESLKKAEREPSQEYTPADFLRQFGAVMAICLGLALLAQVLIAIVGQ